MNAPATRISLYLTLGIAAVDMLSCAFISSILLCVMFLLPKTEPSGGGTGAEHLLVFQWAFSSGSAVLGIELQPPGMPSVTVLTNEAEFFPSGQDCSSLSKGSVSSGSCKLIVSDDAAGGMLIIEDPRAGAWNAEISYGDSIDGMNISGPDEVDFDLNVIGRKSIAIRFAKIRPAQAGLSVRSKAAEQHYSANDIASALDIQ